MPGGLKAARALGRNVEIRKMRRMGWLVKEIALEMGVSARTVVKATKGSVV